MALRKVGKYKLSKEQQTIYEHDVDTASFTSIDISGAFEADGLCTAKGGLTVSNGQTSTLNGNCIFGNATSDTIGFYGVTPTAQLSSGDQAATNVAGITNFPGDGAASISDATDLEAACDAIRALETLVNRLRADLVSLGLIKGSA
tara:strand:+ start:236 stop:673 length:438 start_codon:yes stop_codon:yes gene_type:complete